MLTEIIIKELGLETLPKETQANLISKVGENCMKRLVLDIYEIVPEDKRKEFDALIDSSRFEELLAFVESYIPNPDVFVEQSIKKELAEFRALAGIHS